MHAAPRSLLRLATLTVITLTAPLAGRLAAQTSNAAPNGADSVTTVTHDSLPAAVSHSGAALTGLRSGVHAPETARSARPNAAATRANLGQSEAMMIVGGAALITGAIIGGDPGTIIMVGGAVIGLYGLYKYLQ